METKPRLPLCNKFGSGLFAVSIFTLAIPFILEMYWKAGGTSASSPENSHLLLLYMISGCLLFYPSLCLAGIGDDPEKYFSEGLGTVFVPAFFFWLMVFVSVLQALVTMLFGSFSETTISPEEARLIAKVTWSYIWLPFASVAISLVCIIVTSYYWNSYRKRKMLPKERT